MILKSAIFEEPFQPKMAASSEVVRGFGATEFPSLLGYVATTPKSRAEVPLVTDKGDPLLAHWQYGLGRSVAFTSDARAKWGKGWVGWSKYRQFWSQAVQWSLRKIESSDFVTDVTVDQGEGRLRVEALDKQGNFRNFLNLEAAVVSPKGEKQTVRLNQTGPGHYEGLFKSLEVGAYLINLLERKEGNVIASQVLGASVNYSPEFAAIEPNIPLLRRIAEAGGGRVLDLRKPLEGPFSHDRMTTRQPLPLFDWLMRLAILLFPIDVAVRRVQIDTEEWKRFFIKLLRRIPGFRRKEEAHDTNESLGSLLATREAVRAQRSAPVVEVNPDLFRPQQTPVAGSTVGGTIQPRVDPPGQATESPAGGSQSSGAEPSTTSRLLEAKKRAQKKP